MNEEELLTYYDEADNYYRWLRLVVKLQLNVAAAENFRSNEASLDADQLAALEPLIHEYTHFLQHVGTLWGARVLYDLITRALLLGCGNDRGNTAMVKRGEEIVMELRKCIPDKKHMRPISTEARIQFSWTIEIGSVRISTGQMSAGVDIRVICECWARCASKLWLGWNDQKIHDHNATLASFHQGVGRLQWSSRHEYWLLFEYFYHNSFCNVANGVCRLCCYLLNYRDPEAAFVRFATYMEANHTKDLGELISAWYSSIDESNPRQQSWDGTLQQYDKLILLGRKHGNQNEVIKELCGLAEFFKPHLHQDARFSESGAVPNDTLRIWRSRMASTGTPIMSFQDATEIWGPTTTLKQGFMNIVGLEVVLSLRRVEIFECPFSRKLPICLVNKGDVCGSQPYLKNPNPDGEECLFCQSMTMLGIDGAKWQAELAE